MMQNNNTDAHRSLIESAFEDRRTISPESAGVGLISAIEATLCGLERGVLRVAEPGPRGWQVKEWLKEAVLR